MGKENWKDIIYPENYMGIYQISDLGSVKGLNRFKKSCYGSVSKLSGGVRKPIKYKNSGYLSIILSNGIDRKQILIHRLVAFHFIPNPDNKPCVNHKNGIRTDNRAVNLEWVILKIINIHRIY